MKRTGFFVAGLFLLSILSGILLSKASLVGRAGMTLFYQEYNFLKTWWKGAVLIFITLLLLFIIQGQLQKNKPLSKARLINIVAVVLALAGLYFTYLDFSNSVTHRWLGTAFHTGGYLFWIGWLAISVFYLFPIRINEPLSAQPSRTKSNYR